MPLPIMRTPRLILQPFAAEVIDTLHALWTDRDVRRYLWDDRVISRTRAAEVLQLALDSAERHGIGYWTLREKSGGAVLGDVGFQFIGQTSEIELMCGLRRVFWKRGLATEAAQAALHYLWDATLFTTVFARADLPNERSVRLMQRLEISYHSTTPTLVTYVLHRPGRPPSQSVG
jgi:ribosomal-protein-alanine N-acetyltransferase